MMMTKGNDDDEMQWHVTPDHVLYPCNGYWGIALKEWEVIKQVLKIHQKFPKEKLSLNVH